MRAVGNTLIVTWSAVSGATGDALDCTVQLNSRTTRIRSVSAGSRQGGFAVKVASRSSYQAVKTCTYSGGTLTATSTWVSV